jgi:DNA (cytosine-5)-methyltransferase 1
LDEQTHIDIFSGIGGFAVAASWAGYTSRVFCEQDAYCTKVLKRHWPDVPVIRDIRDFDGSKWRGSRLLTGGFPCQPFSICGEHRGKEDDRYLWPEMLRVIEEARPAWVVAENVTGIITVALDEVLSQLASLRYSCGVCVLPACAVNAPHRRDRVWIIAADTSGKRLQGSEEAGDNGEDWPELRDKQFARFSGVEGWNKFPTVAAVCGRDDGIRNRIQRIKALGNSIVPQVAYEILKLTTPNPIEKNKHG